MTDRVNIKDDDTGGNVSDLDFIYSITKFLDGYVRQIKWVAYGIGITGLIVTARSIYLFKQFVHASDIPLHFIERNVRLQGIVNNVGSDGTLHVKHIPIASLKWMKYFKPVESGLVDVQLGGVSLTETGISWLKERLTSRQIWFCLLYRPTEGNVVHTVVTTKKNILQSIRVNEYLVCEGLATIRPISAKPDNTIYILLLQKLLKAELYSKRKGRGIWKPPPLRDRAFEKVLSLRTKTTDYFRERSRKIREWLPWHRK